MSEQQSYEPSTDGGNPYLFTAYADAYEEGVSEAQAFIDRHPHGFPAMTMQQYEVEWSDDPYERAWQEGWYDRLADEVGTEENPNESWRQKMETFGIWPKA